MIATLRLIFSFSKQTQILKVYHPTKLLICRIV